MRLNKYLAHAGVASRRESDRLIQEGTVTVNDKLVVDPAYNVQKNDKIYFGEKQITLQKEKIVYMLNKPKNVITTAKDTHGRKTVLDFVPRNMRLFPIGRLDKNTTGLILITNDGKLANSLMHPKNRVPRYYEVEIDGRLSDKEIVKIKKGIFIGDGEWGKGEVVNQITKKGRSIINILLHQGKKREVRRIFEFLNKKVFHLHRYQYGNLQIGNLQPGQWRVLNKKEIDLLHNN
jgi:23S rRNA pseudouridine2605 synthase